MKTKHIVVCGYMIRHPVAGNILAYFHYILGLYRLGHDITYLEESGWPKPCFNPNTGTYGDDPSIGMQAVVRLLRTHAVNADVGYVNRETGEVVGLTRSALEHRLCEADLLLNLGGVCWLPEFTLCKRRAVVDMDPFFTQTGRFASEARDQYATYFSYGANIGRATCSIPSDGRDWHVTLPPVVPDVWQVTDSSAQERAVVHGLHKAPFTTIANWNAYGATVYRGERFGQKDEEFLHLLDLPRQTTQELELALAGADTETWAQFKRAGWSVRDAEAVSATVPCYRSYVCASRGELSAAKNAYVRTRSGWFSDRSVCYLAAGRPVILQDTGFSDWLPTGRGVLAFSSVDEALGCIDDVNTHYAVHCEAARDAAQSVFSYRVVLPPLLEAALGSQAT